eukprot:TRINITY_DN39391_c0_g1_i2.p1 TRINITY_DN39391_c0_g1~~TRINITY_DN39391_c0_g1_i2.p1  ORF type:complete len:241 (-),score=33.46 TRINITY_DN39391_c0_g1_i2:131-853(-)
MCLGALMVIFRSVMNLYGVYVTGESAPLINFDASSGAFLGLLIVLKLVLWCWCRTLAGRGSVSLDAVAQDHRNDVVSNGAALLAAGMGSNPSFWISDPIGASLISLWIIWAWIATGKEQADLLVGKAADPAFLSVVRELAETHDPQATLDIVRAYHFGPKFLVEIELVMPRDTPLEKSHDVGILLQHKIESLDDCERCFVHIDYQHREVDDHDPKVPVQKKVSDAQLLHRSVTDAAPSAD